jgi:hypothetical protein
MVAPIGNKIVSLSTYLGHTDRFNLPYLLELLDDICRDCDDPQRKENCARPGCLIGFAKKCLMFSIQSGSLEVPGAVTLMPKDDFNSYYAELTAPVLAESCRQCKECRENHSPDCVIALVRTAVESTLLFRRLYTTREVFSSTWLRFASRIQNGHQLATHLRR